MTNRNKKVTVFVEGYDPVKFLSNTIVGDAGKKIKEAYQLEGGVIYDLEGTLLTDDLALGDHPGDFFFKNWRSKGRGVAKPRAESEGLYEVADERIRVDLKIQNGNYALNASALCVGGASNQLTLPARKIVQLGLTPFGKPSISIGSTNDRKRILKFKPSVEVTMQFSRGEDVIEERTKLLVANCNEDEYERELRECLIEISSETSKKRKLSDVSSTSRSLDSAVVPKSIKLSPVDHPNDRIVLGQGALSIFYVHGNFKGRVLEVNADIEYEG